MGRGTKRCAMLHSLNEKPQTPNRLSHLFQNSNSDWKEDNSNSSPSSTCSVCHQEETSVLLHRFPFFHRSPKLPLNTMNCFPSNIAMLMVLSLLVFFHSEGTEAKRGCASFGHSCYGGMGKRASDLIDTNGEVMLNSVPDEENPAFVFTGPRSSIPSRAYQKMTPEQYDNISKVVRQWIQSYRRAQELQDENIV